MAKNQGMELRVREEGERDTNEGSHVCSGKMVKHLIFYTIRLELSVTFIIYILLQLEISPSFRSRNTKRKLKG